MNIRKVGSGQALLEFAFVILLFIFIFMTFIDLGRAIITYGELSNAVREGTRYGIVNSTCAADAETKIANVIHHYSTMLNPADMSVVITPSLIPPCSVLPDNKLSVSVRYVFRPITPGLLMLVGPSQFFTLEAHSSALIAPLYQR